MEDNTFESALTVNKGIPQPPSTNPNALHRLKNMKRRALTVNDYVKGIIDGNRTILSQAITLIESSVPQHQETAQEIIQQCLPKAGKSIRVGITGVPGVGKSTFIESMGKHLTSQGHKLAVLAIDPSSERSGGSILGDKTRMEELSTDVNAFIRPSPSAGTLGGVARRTRETIILCEAAGFDVIFIETVGVGQSETLVHSMVDFFLLLMLAGAGDELQGIKRGIMEMADTIVITKADGNNLQKAQLARIEYQNALHLFPPAESGWTPVVTTCSSTENIGIAKVWEIIGEFFALVQRTAYFDQNRRNQSRHWMYETIDDKLRNHFYHDKHRKTELKMLENMVLDGQISSFAAASKLLKEYFKG
jgi:LAO/AO transport system kinase